MTSTVAPPAYVMRDRETEERDARDLLTECIDTAKAHAKMYQEIARVNESFALGEQWWARDYSVDQTRFKPDTWFQSEDMPRVYVNKLGNLNITLAALLTRNRPTVKAVPASSEPEDTFRAQVAQHVIENLQFNLSTAEKTHQSVIYAGQHGMAGWKAIYNPETDSVELDTLTVFNVLFDPTCEDYRKSPFCIFKDYRSKAWAKTTLRKLGAGLNDASLGARDPTTEQYDAADGVKMDGVPCFELWHKPTDRYPQGLYAFFVGETLVEFIPSFPNTFYTNESSRPTYMFPAVMFKMRTVRGNLYGHTNFSDCINLQRALNEINARILRLVRQATHAIMVLPAEQRDTFRADREGFLWVPQAQMKDAQAIGFVRSFPIPKELFAERTYFEAKLADVMGLNQITSGAETRSISGRAIENIVELDAQKNSDATKSLEAALRDLWTLILRLVQANYREARKIKITDGSAVDVLEFSGASINGVDVRLEPASETDNLSDAQQADADERAKAGLPPREAMQGAEAYGNMAAAFAEQAIERYLRGEQVDLKPDDTAWDVFLDVLQKFKARAVARNRPEDWQALQALEAHVRRILVPQAAVMAQQEQAPPPEQAPEAPPPQAPPVDVTGGIPQ